MPSSNPSENFQLDAEVATLADTTFFYRTKPCLEPSISCGPPATAVRITAFQLPIYCPKRGLEVEILNFFRIEKTNPKVNSPNYRLE
jgi:hypothetical protein